MAYYKNDEEEGEFEEEQGKCMVDVDEAQIECCRLMNNLVFGLNLTNCPLFTNSRDIQVPNLVEVNCRLLGLSFREYTPDKRPWNDVEKIILSLRQKFGTSLNFNHLDTMLIAQREPTHLVCLLQVLNTIYEYYKGHGKSFAIPVTEDLTVLTNSTMNAPGSSRSTSPSISPILPSIPEERPSELHESEGTEFEVDILIKPRPTESHGFSSTQTPSTTESSFQTPQEQRKRPIHRKHVRPTFKSRSQKFKSKSHYPQNEHSYPSPSSDSSEQSPSTVQPPRPPARIQIQSMDDETISNESPNGANATTTTVESSFPDIRINIDLGDTTKNSESSRVSSVDHSKSTYPSSSSDYEQSPSTVHAQRLRLPPPIQTKSMNDETGTTESSSGANATASTVESSFPDIKINIDLGDTTRDSGSSRVSSADHSKSPYSISSSDYEQTPSTVQRPQQPATRMQPRSIDNKNGTVMSESPNGTNATTTTAGSSYPDIKIVIDLEDTTINSGSSITPSVDHSKSRNVDSPSMMEVDQTKSSVVSKSTVASRAKHRLKSVSIAEQSKQPAPPQSSDICTTSVRPASKPIPSDICTTSAQPASKPKPTESDIDSLAQVNQIHDEIQRTICNKLRAFEKEIFSLKSPSKSKKIKSCCEEKADGKGSSRIESGSRIPSTSKTNNNTKPHHSRAGAFLHRYSSKSKSKIRHDYFGKPYKEKFPYFPGGLIKPRCHSPPKTAKSTSTPRHWTKQQNDKFCENLYKLLGIPENESENNPVRCSNVLVDDNGQEIKQTDPLPIAVDENEGGNE